MFFPRAIDLVCRQRIVSIGNCENPGTLVDFTADELVTVGGSTEVIAGLREDR